VAYTFHELKEKTVVELREIAKGIQHEAVLGYTQLNKEHLLVAICNALGIATHEHHDVVGIDKTSVKVKMRALKQERDKAIEAHDHARIKALRRQLHNLNHEIRKKMV
jgi:hypothetical protein